MNLGQLLGGNGRSSALRPLLISDEDYAAIVSSDPTQELNERPVAAVGVIRQTASAPAVLVTTDMVKRDNEDVMQIANTDVAIRERQSLKQQQQQRQIAYFDDRTEVCGIRPLDQLRDHIGTLNAYEYAAVLKDNFYDAGVMLNAMCVANSIFYGLPNDYVAPNERVRHWISKLKQIGADSVSGVALRAELDTVNDVFIVKAPRDPSNSELLHEWFVGTFGLNSVRQIVPNFAYIMGAFMCSPPIVDGDKRVLAWCNNETSPVSYVVYENIQPAVDLRQYVATCSFTNFLSMFLQTLYALQVAYQVCNFTHYDLHDENVLVRQITDLADGDIVLIPYETETGQIEYLKAPAVATVIDYGLSHIKYKGEHYGVYDLTPYGVRPQKAFPLHDAYKLLLMSMRSMEAAGNTSCFDGCRNIVSFFNSSETAEQIIDGQLDSYYYLPFTAETGSRTHYDLTRHIRANVPEAADLFVQQPSGVRILGCTGTDVCVSDKSGAYRKLGLEKKEMVDNIFEFYDLMTRLQNQERFDTFDSVGQSYENIYKSDKLLVKDMIESNIDKINKVVATLKPIVIRGMSAELLLTDTDAVANYEIFLMKIVYIIDRLQRIQDEVYSLLFSARYYTDQEYETYGIETLDSVRQIIPAVEKILADIKSDARYIRKIRRSNKDQVQDLIRNGSGTSWYFTTMPSYGLATAQVPQLLV